MFVGTYTKKLSVRHVWSLFKRKQVKQKNKIGRRTFGTADGRSYIIRCYYIVPWWRCEEDCSCVVIIVIKKPYVCRTGHVSVNLARRIKTVMSAAALEWANFHALGPFTMLYIKTNRS